MRVSEYLSAFIEHEERAELFARSARGVRYWQAIRHDVFQESLQALGLAERAHRALGELPLRSWLPQQLRHLPLGLRRSIWRGLPRAELLVANHPRHVLHAGQYICPYSQPLLDAISRPRVVLEGHFQGRYAAPGAHQPTAYVDLPLALAHASFWLRERRGQGLGARELAELAELQAGLARALGAAPPLAAIVKRVRTAVLATLAFTPRYERLLDHVRPRLIVVVIGYRLLHQILTQVAHRRGVRVVELQHGTLGPAHPAYNFAPGRRPESFPDDLLLFGELWRTLTPGLPLPAERTPAIGHAWLELQRERFVRAAASTGAARRVLFLSQRSIGRPLSQLAAELHALAPAGALEITYRLHPSEAVGWRTAYPELARSGVAVQAADSQPLHAAMAAADAQVGVYSTSLLEGLAFELDTYLAPLPGHEQLQFLCDSGYARAAPSAGQLLELLTQPRAASERAAIDLRRLWAPGAAANFAAFVQSALAG